MHWIVLANSSRARILRGDPWLHHLAEVDDLLHPEGRLGDQDLVSDDWGRRRGASPGTASRTTPQTSLEDRHLQAFARGIDARLLEGLDAGAYERLILVASPRLLGHLRATLSERVQRRVVAELSRDWTTQPLHVLAGLLPGALPEDAGLGGAR